MIKVSTMNILAVVLLYLGQYDGDSGFYGFQSTEAHPGTRGQATGTTQGELVEKNIIGFLGVEI